MLIDYRYFIHPKTRIAGIDTVRDGKPTETAERIINDITAYIATYEPRFLRMLLGVNYESVIANNKHIKSLLIDPNRGTSIIADYVYFYYMRDFSTFNTIAGEKYKVADNSERASANHRLITLWNDMVEKCTDIVKDISTESIHPELYSEIFCPINIESLWR